MLRPLITAIAAASLLGATPRPYDALHWRLVGPFRGGRTVAVSGVSSQPGVYYMAPTDGGVWKSSDYGRTWHPIFDRQHTGSIGALAVAPSNPQIIYAGSGEGLRRPDLSVGDGMYKSTDGGQSWTHVGLPDAQQINAIVINPQDSNRVYVAVMGHPYGANAQRGVYRSINGGTTWQKVLGNDNDTGASTVVIDPNDSSVLYANMWASRNPPWRLQSGATLYQDGGIFKSTDGGTTWHQLKAGLPEGMSRAGIAIAKIDSRRVYAWVNDAKGCGIYRSNDAGASWQKVNTEARICARGEDFSGIAVDPVDRDVVYVTNTTTYRSLNAGKTWTAIKGAPGGDDYHTIWIDPANRNIIFLGSDQGATLSVNYGQSWSSWYNQPSAQFYHVITDNRFPYWIFGGQQESGSAEVASRSEDGVIWERYWHPVGASEYGYIAPDPLHANRIYGAGAGQVTRYDEATQQTSDVSPVYGGRFFRGRFRYNRTNPLVFNRVDKHTLYLGSNVIFATENGGRNWRVISPDLTREHPGVPASLGAFASTPAVKEERGVVYSIAPSYIDRKLIWAGTDDGLIWITSDAGMHWRNVTPPSIGPWSKITQIDPSHFDRNTAYVSVSRFRLDDLRPYIYRTHDGGRHWQRVTIGLPSDAPVNAVREDPLRRGLLFAGTERTVYVSFDDGASWESLQRDLPSTSIRDLVVHKNDIVVGTHGRSFWVLDDISPLRSVQALKGSNAAVLFKPADAYRVRRSAWTDTPLPPEEPSGENPPDGAVIDYYLPAAGTVAIEIDDAAGHVVRHYSSNDRIPPVDPALSIPTYWLRPARIPSGAQGMHRFIWDYRYNDPLAVSHDYPISAVAHDTPRVPQGVLALPGVYTVKLAFDGRDYSQSFRLRMDPRVQISREQLRAQFNLASRVVAMMQRSYLLAKAKHEYATLNDRLAALLDVIESADSGPTPQAIGAVTAIEHQLLRSP
jgi:photosystem II stability/assembly factor-like uncharacterized protein